MYVRALYDYTADDPTSLSMRKGEIIHVLTQLDSGWWDGIVNGVRGWFPSNYCMPVAVAPQHGHYAESGGEDADLDDLGDEYEDDGLDPHEEAGTRQNGRVGQTGQEEAAFWIPQATPDGRLFYFNTLTGDSTMELPLESPTSANEAPPRAHANAFAAEHARPPREMLAQEDHSHEDTDQSASEAEAMVGSRSSAV